MWPLCFEIYVTHADGLTEFYHWSRVGSHVLFKILFIPDLNCSFWRSTKEGGHTAYSSTYSLQINVMSMTNMDESICDQLHDLCSCGTTHFEFAMWILFLVLPLNGECRMEPCCLP